MSTAGLASSISSAAWPDEDSIRFVTSVFQSHRRVMQNQRVVIYEKNAHDCLRANGEDPLFPDLGFGIAHVHRTIEFRTVQDRHARRAEIPGHLGAAFDHDRLARVHITTAATGISASSAK